MRDPHGGRERALLSAATMAAEAPSHARAPGGPAARHLRVLRRVELLLLLLLK